MATIDVTADYSQLQTATNTTTTSLNQLAARIGSITSEVQQFNAAGILIGSTLKGITKDAGTFTAQLKLSAEQQKLLKQGLDPGALEEARISYQKTSQAVEELTKKQGTLGEVAQRVGRAFQYFVAYRAFNFITNQIKEGIAEANKFQIQLSLIRTLSQDNQMSFSKWGSEVRKVSDASGFDINETGKAFYDAISNQVARGPQTGQFVQSASDLARVTGSSLTDSVNLLSSALNSYNLGAKDAERVSAIFFRTIDEGRVVAGELANVFGRVGVLGANLGISMEDLNATLAITTQKGFTTSDAMTLLTNLMIKLEKPTQATGKFFESLGVTSGEEAIQLYGYTGVLRKMVELTRSGKVDVSAFFDEIRGRKQFGIFEQSIDDIEKFSNKLKDTTSTMKNYNSAINIRGESPADYFNKQWNTFKNIFKDDIGQALIDLPANAGRSLNYLSQTLDPILPSMQTAKYLALGAGVAFGVWSTSALVAAGSTVTLAGSLTALSTAIPVIAAIGVTSYAAVQLYKGLDKRIKIDIDKTQLDDALDKVLKFKKERDSLTNTRQRISDKDIIQARADSGFRGIAGILAQAQIQNNQVLESAKEKTKTLGEVLKISFAGYADTLRTKVSDLKKAVTESRNEIEKSAKSLLTYRESLDQIIFNRKRGYATDEQKVGLDEQRIKELESKATRFLTSNDSQERDEGRKLFDEVARMIDEVENVKQQIQFDAAKQRGETGIFYFNTQNVQSRLDALFNKRNALEKSAQDFEIAGIKKKTELEKAAQEQLRKFQEGLRQYDNLSPYDNSGKIKKEYQTEGKFDPNKFGKDLDKIEMSLRENFSGTLTERQQFELNLHQQRLNYTKEAAAFERAEYLKTAQAKLQADQELFKSKLQQTEKDRENALAKEVEIQQSLKGQGQIYRDFANAFQDNFGRLIDDKQKAKIAALVDSIKEYELKVGKLNANKTEDGFRPVDVSNVQDAYKAMRLRYEDAYRAGGFDPKNQQQFLNKNGEQIFLSDAKELADNYFKTLGDLNQKIRETRETEKTLFNELQKNTEEPLKKLKGTFPDLAASADSAMKAVQQSAITTVNDGIQPLINKLNDLKQAFDNLKLGAMNAIDDEISSVIGGSDAAYAATGGIAGMFPGQPRGQDRYPIWAAAGERIFDANTSRRYKPLFDAIAQRRVPQYMAMGGIVGHNSSMTVGDINITVQGGKTNEETARVIGSRLERQLRLGNTRLKG